MDWSEFLGLLSGLGFQVFEDFLSWCLTKIAEYILAKIKARHDERGSGTK